MISARMFKVKAPIGNHVLPKEVMSGSELREYAVQVASDAIWREKMEKDPIEKVVEYLEMVGYTIK